MQSLTKMPILVFGLVLGVFILNPSLVAAKKSAEKKLPKVEAVAVQGKSPVDAETNLLDTNEPTESEAEKKEPKIKSVWLVPDFIKDKDYAKVKDGKIESIELRYHLDKNHAPTLEEVLAVDEQGNPTYEDTYFEVIYHLNVVATEAARPKDCFTKHCSIHKTQTILKMSFLDYTYTAAKLVKTKKELWQKMVGQEWYQYLIGRYGSDLITGGASIYLIYKLLDVIQHKNLGAFAGLAEHYIKAHTSKEYIKTNGFMATMIIINDFAWATAGLIYLNKLKDWMFIHKEEVERINLGWILESTAAHIESGIPLPTASDVGLWDMKTSIEIMQQIASGKKTKEEAQKELDAKQNAEKEKVAHAVPLLQVDDLDKTLKQIKHLKKYKLNHVDVEKVR